MAQSDFEERVALTRAHLSIAEILSDYRIGWQSRHASLIGRREVMSG